MALDREQAELAGLRTSGAPDLGPAPIRSTELGGGSSSGGGPKISLPEEDFAPAGARVLHSITDVSPAPTATATIFATEVVTGLRFRLYRIGWDADDLSALANLTWTLYVNDSAKPGFSNMPAGYGSLEEPLEVIAHIQGPALVRIDVTNTSAFTPFTYRLHLVGWFYNLVEP